MKYYSDVTKKVYETEEELKSAEDKVRADELEKEKKALAVSKEKKELTNAIKQAEENLDKAYKELDVAREKAKDIQKEALKQIENVLHSAEEKVKKAQAERFDAVKAFNDKYGKFTIELSTSNLADEMNRVWRSFDKLFGDFFF